MKNIEISCRLTWSFKKSNDAEKLQQVATYDTSALIWALGRDRC